MTSSTDSGGKIEAGILPGVWTVLAAVPVTHALMPLHKLGAQHVFRRDQVALGWFSSPRRALDAAIALAIEVPNIRLGMAMDDVDEEGRTLLEFQALEFARYGEAGQITIPFAMQELLRKHAPDEVQFVDFGKQQVGIPPRQERLFTVLAPGLKAISPPAAPPALRHLEGERFFGRDAELEELRTRLDLSRLNLVSGEPGIGKSTLVRRFVQEVSDQFPGGAYLIDLKEVTRPQQVLPAIVSQLEIGTGLQFSWLDELAEHLRGAETLLVLDGGDQVAEDVLSLMESLLEQCPALQGMVVCRRMPSAYARQAFRLKGLELPAMGLPQAALDSYPAVQILQDQSAHPVYDADAIAAIVQLLEGNPLALDMASLLLRTRTPIQVLGMLRADSGNGLSAQSNALNRSLGTSFRLLPANALILLRVASVHEGAFTAKSVFTLAGGTLSAEEVDSGLSVLLDASLIDAGPAFGEERIFSLSSMIRQFAREELRKSEHGPAVQRRYRKWRKDLAVHLPQVPGGNNRATAMLDTFRHDLRGYLLGGMRSRSECPVVVRTLVDNMPYWLQRDDLLEAQEFVVEGMMSHFADKLVDYPRLVNCAALIEHRLGDLAKARIYAKEALRMAIERNHKLTAAKILNTLSAISSDSDRYRSSIRYSGKSVQLIRELGILPNFWFMLSNQAAFFVSLYRIEPLPGLLDQAEAHMTEAWEIGGKDAQNFAKSTYFQNLAFLAMARQDFKKGWSAIREGATLFDASASPKVLAHYLVAACQMAVESGQTISARRLYRATISQFEIAKQPFTPRYRRIFDEMEAQIKPVGVTSEIAVSDPFEILQEELRSNSI